MTDPVPYGLTDEVLNRAIYDIRIAAAVASLSGLAAVHAAERRAMRAVLVPAIEQALAKRICPNPRCCMPDEPCSECERSADDEPEPLGATGDWYGDACRQAAQAREDADQMSIPRARPGATYRHKHYLGTGLANGLIRCPDLYGEKVDAVFDPAFWVEE